MTSAPAFENDDVRTLQTIDRAATQKADQVIAITARRALAEMDLTSAREALTCDPTFENADRYVEAKTLVENLTSVVAALDDAGGVAAIRDKILARSHATPHFNRGFQSRLAALEKLIALARKRLGARIGELTEANVLAGLIEADHVVSATRGFIAGVNVQLETARSCLAEGAPGNRAARSFDQKFAILTSALPVPPAST